jgi:hypothetical protein
VCLCVRNGTQVELVLKLDGWRRGACPEIGFAKVWASGPTQK